MLGVDVSQYTINAKASDAVMSLRLAFDKVETFSKWLALNPNTPETDPLVEKFGFTVDEAYLLRLFFQNFETVRLETAAQLEIGRNMTGLE